MAPVPGEKRQQIWPSTVAYVARLIIHRYAMLGVLDEAGLPLREMGILAAPAVKLAPSAQTGAMAQMAGKACSDCGNRTLIRKDGCEFCTACGFVGQCG
jgi:ribonucleoside-diphosphate reductase alpha chain